jgi:hypothetical protein
MEFHIYFQEATPDTSGYMIAGYAIAFLVMTLYVASLYFRRRNLEQDMTVLTEMDKSEPPVEKSQPAKNPVRPARDKSAKSVTKRAKKKQP